MSQRSEYGSEMLGHGTKWLLVNYCWLVVMKYEHANDGDRAQ